VAGSLAGVRAGVWARWSAVALTAGAASAWGAGAGTASADESYGDGSRIGPQTALIRTGQIEDPLEHVLDHVTVTTEMHFHS
jgi:hypothetical protein